MSAEFVRYSPEIETFDPKLGEHMEPFRVTAGDVG
jgi:hypothetical protein